MRYDAIIIGAGMSGLAAGIRLAQLGRRVVVVEKHYVWGGLNSFYGKDGYRFDVGLHALTNFVPKGTRGTPLTRTLKQLRLRYDDLKLGEHHESEVLFPGVRLRFTNDFEVLVEEVARAFPREVDAFRALADEVERTAFDERPAEYVSARDELARRFTEPMLVEMLLLPTCYYGSAVEGDVEWDQFKVLFKSIFLEGLARPEGGVRTILNLLVKRYRELDGELVMNCGVERIATELGPDGEERATGVRLADGRELEADAVVSSAGYVETLGLCGAEHVAREVEPADVGRISFLETICVVDRPPAELGYTAATSFFCTAERLDYSVPDELCDTRSGLVSSPNNYSATEPMRDQVLRMTVLANPERWRALEGEAYAREKTAWAERAERDLVAFTDGERTLPGPRAAWTPHTVYRDTFTPSTIEHFTSHPRGIVYGAPRKHKRGETPVSNLRLCGTDHGYLGIVGAMASGCIIANDLCLTPAST